MDTRPDDDWNSPLLGNSVHRITISDTDALSVNPVVMTLKLDLVHRCSGALIAYKDPWTLSQSVYTQYMLQNDLQTGITESSSTHFMPVLENPYKIEHHQRGCFSYALVDK